MPCCSPQAAQAALASVDFLRLEMRDGKPGGEGGGERGRGTVSDDFEDLSLSSKDSPKATVIDRMRHALSPRSTVGPAYSPVASKRGTSSAVDDSDGRRVE